jgi:ferredoxin-NADP reductase
MTFEAEDVLSLVLTRPDGGHLPQWSLGAHIDLVLANGLIRQYSLCSSPADRDHWKIAVLREPESSGGSRYIHETLRPGDLVEFIGPRNSFPLIQAEEYLLIAGGIGVTPLLPMTFALEELGARWRLLYGGRRHASMAFLRDLERLSERVTVRPEDRYGLLDLAGAIGEFGEQAAVYCCGPEPLIAAVEAQCAATGRAAPHVERFHARPAHALELEESGTTDGEFELVLALSGRRFTIPADKTIIQVLAENRVFVATSCTEGYCGVCETEVVDGIPDHRDDYLSPERRATNQTMMVCCGRSKTPELTLRL